MTSLGPAKPAKLWACCGVEESEIARAQHPVFFVPRIWATMFDVHELHVERFNGLL